MEATYNVKDEAGREAHDLRMFSDHGRQTLQNFLIELAREYTLRLGRPEDYSFEMGIVLGVPFFGYAKNVKSQEDLYSRMLAIAQILGIDVIIGRAGDTEVEIRL